MCFISEQINYVFMFCCLVLFIKMCLYIFLVGASNAFMNKYSLCVYYVKYVTIV